MINVLQGDATSPNVPGVKIIAHICNDAGGWGSGFVLAVSAKWKRPEEQYRKWEAGSPEVNMAGGQLVLTPPIFRLGEVQLVQVEPEVYVANMIAQKLYTGKPRESEKRPPIRYEALVECLIGLRTLADKLDASVHMPRIGCERAGASWAKVETYINTHLASKAVVVYIYDFPGSTFNP